MWSNNFQHFMPLPLHTLEPTDSYIKGCANETAPEAIPPQVTPGAAALAEARPQFWVELSKDGDTWLLAREAGPLGLFMIWGHQPQM